MEWGRIPANPAGDTGLPLPSRETHEQQPVERVIDRAQLEVLLSRSARTLAAETRLRAASEAGLRGGEVLGLHWPDVNLVERRLEVRRGVLAGAGGRRAAGTPRGASGLPRRRADGRRLTQRQLLERALQRCGLVDAAGRPLVSFRGLRHSAGSVMLAVGVPVIVVSRQLGHANPQITATVYAHLLGELAARPGRRRVRQPDRAETLRETLRGSAPAPKDAARSGS